MDSGIRATVAFEHAAGCPVAQFATAAGVAIDGVSTSVATETPPVTEFLVEAGSVADREPVFSYGHADLYRVTHDGDCPCTCLGSYDCPVHQYTVANGELTLVFHAAGFGQLQDVMATLRERYAVDVRRLLHPPLEGQPEERRFVNRGKLTDRQLQALRTAYEAGYFERPRRTNATEVAEQLGISRSTFAEHLAAAQRKLFEDVFDGR
jgi:hypothetical protein